MPPPPLPRHAPPTALGGALERMRDAYVRLEPAGQDTWNPVYDEAEMWHRTRLLHEACGMLRRLPRPLHELKVLDVGCGVGRSSRLLVDLGVRPSQLVATDLRADALAQARSSNPAIDWRHVTGFDDWPSEAFDLVVQCTVFSSIPGAEARRATAALMSRSAGDAGHVLWWDSRVANEFAGGDALDPRELFADRELIAIRRVPMLPTTDEALRPLRGLRPLLTALLGPLGYPRTHCVALFGRRNTGKGGLATPPAQSAAVAPAASPPPAASPVVSPPAPPTPPSPSPQPLQPMPDAGAPAHAAPAAARAGADPSAAAVDLLRDLPVQPAAQAGLTLGAWQMFQHRPLLEIYAAYYGYRVVDADGVLVVVKSLPLLGAMRAQVYSPEASAVADWPRRLDRLAVGEMVVMTNQPACAGWQSASADLVSMVIDLRGDEAALWARFEQRARTAARKGERAGVEIVPTTQPGDLHDFYAVVHRLSDGGQRFPLPALGLLEALLAAGHGTLYLARQQQQVLGGCVVLRERYAHALLSGFDAQACGGLPSTHLYVQVMLHEQAHGMPFLDFGPHDVRTDGKLVLAKRAFKPLIVPAYRYERPGSGWRPLALTAAKEARALALRAQRVTDAARPRPSSATAARG